MPRGNARQKRNAAAARRQHGIHRLNGDLYEARQRVAELEASLVDVLNSYEDERARIKAGNADWPSVSGQTFINRARSLLQAAKTT